jgi:DNA-dependent RNA polymerase auxiliary subunit epsilon
MKALPNLFVVQASYSLTKDKTPYRVNSEALGFRVATGQIATSAEMLNPWKYDVEFLSELNGGTVKLVKNSTDLRLDSLAGSGSAHSLSSADFRVESRGNAGPERVTTVGPKRNQVQLLRRSSPSSLAVLTPRNPITASGLQCAPAPVQSRDSWDKVIVFRLREKPGNGQRTVDVLAIGARREGDGIRLTEPVDEAVFGSPILTPDGVIGLVQDEQTGTFLPEDILRAPVLPEAH